MVITEGREGGVTVVALAGRVDSVTAGELEPRLLQYASGPAPRLLVDLSGVEYISSAGLRVLLRLVSRLREVQGELVLCSLAHGVREVFELAGFMAVFAVEPTRPLALARLAPR